MRTVVLTSFLLLSLWLRSQTDTFALVGMGIDTSALKINAKKEWNYEGEKCNGPKAIYYTSGFYQGRLNRVIWFTKGKIDSVVIYSLAFFPTAPTTLAIQSKIKIDLKKNRRHYIIYSSQNVRWARYEYKITNHYDLSSPMKLITIDQDIRFVDDGCQYDYHPNLASHAFRYKTLQIFVTLKKVKNASRRRCVFNFGGSLLYTFTIQ